MKSTEVYTEEHYDVCMDDVMITLINDSGFYKSILPILGALQGDFHISGVLQYHTCMDKFKNILLGCDKYFKHGCRQSLDAIRSADGWDTTLIDRMLDYYLETVMDDIRFGVGVLGLEDEGKETKTEKQEEEQVMASIVLNRAAVIKTGEHNLALHNQRVSDCRARTKAIIEAMVNPLVEHIVTGEPLGNVANKVPTCSPAQESYDAALTIMRHADGETILANEFTDFLMMSVERTLPITERTVRIEVR